ncbi:MAG: methyltransferase domain-containing protein [Acidobacteriales bacterium]|nr:methyltransferase domain-containing protein [Terriglobales bacterium]
MQAQSGFAPNPTRIFETFTSFHRSAALKAAVEVDVFSAIAPGEATAQAIASRCNASERGIRILCDALVTYGLLEKHGTMYKNTPDTGFFLDRRSPAYMGGAARFLCHPEHAKSWGNLTQAVRTGTTALTGDGNMKIENEIWVDFAKGMAPMVVPGAQVIAKLVRTSAQVKVLDIAAGHGMFGITVAQSSPQAQIYALDWPNVLEVAKEHAEQFGVASRYHTIAGDFFNAELGSGYGVILLTNFLHHFDRSTCVQIIAKCKAALAPGGKIATAEFVPNDDRVSPELPAAFALAMLAGTVAGDAYTFPEFQSMFTEAGLPSTTRHEIAPGHPQTILISQ